MTDRESIHGQYLIQNAKSLGWQPEDGEGPYEFVVRLAYETGYDDAKRGVERKGDPSIKPYSLMPLICLSAFVVTMIVGMLAYFI